MEQRDRLRELLRGLIAERATIEETIDNIFSALGHGGRILVIDPRLPDLCQELGDLGFIFEGYSLDRLDPANLEKLRHRLVITREGERLADPDTMSRYRYGVIWVVSSPTPAVLADRISMVIRDFRMNGYPIRVVRV